MCVSVHNQQGYTYVIVLTVEADVCSYRIGSGEVGPPSWRADE